MAKIAGRERGPLLAFSSATIHVPLEAIEHPHGPFGWMFKELTPEQVRWMCPGLAALFDDEM